jgi:hypothetical protein
LRRSEEVEGLKHQTAMLQLQLKQMSAEHDQQKYEQLKVELEQKQRLQELEYERQRLEADLQRERLKADTHKARRDDYYDERAHARKDTSELIRFIPVLIAAGLAIYVAIQKQQAKS